jgi:hypothetical protein
MRFQERQNKFERRSKLYKLQQKGLHERIPVTRRTFYSFIYIYLSVVYLKRMSVAQTIDQQHQMVGLANKQPERIWNEALVTQF